MACCVGVQRLCAAQAGDGSAADIERKIDYRLDVQSYLQRAGIPGSDFNPSNRIGQVSRTELELEWRPQLGFANEQWEWRLRPRLRSQVTDVLAAGDAHTTLHSELFLGGGELRYSPTPALALSVSREALLWGAAASYSPSNPFSIDNGRNSPYIELDGKDFAKINWFPATGWSLAYIDPARNCRGCCHRAGRYFGRYLLKYLHRRANGGILQELARKPSYPWENGKDLVSDF